MRELASETLEVRACERKGGDAAAGTRWYAVAHIASFRKLKPVVHTILTAVRTMEMLTLPVKNALSRLPASYTKGSEFSMPRSRCAATRKMTSVLLPLPHRGA